MSITKRVLVILCAIVALGFVALGINDVIKTNREIELKKVQLQQKTEQQKKLEVEQLKINTDLQKANELKQAEEAEAERLQKEKEALEQEAERLRREKEQARAPQSTVVTVASATTTTTTAIPTDVRQIVIDAAHRHGVSVADATRIAECESSYRPTIVNYNYWEDQYGVAMGLGGEKYHPTGLYQHLTNYWPARAAQYGYPGASVTDPVANANVTMQMFRDGSRGLWECK